MSTARRDDHGATGGLVRRRQIRRDGRFVNVGHDVVATVGDSHDFVTGLAFRTGRTVRPEQNFLWLGGEDGDGEQQRSKSSEQKGCSVHVFGLVYLRRL